MHAAVIGRADVRHARPALDYATWWWWGKRAQRNEEFVIPSTHWPTIMSDINPTTPDTVDYTFAFLSLSPHDIFTRQRQRERNRSFQSSITHCSGIPAHLWLHPCIVTKTYIGPHHRNNFIQRVYYRTARFDKNNSHTGRQRYEGGIKITKTTTFSIYIVTEWESTRLFGSLVLCTAGPTLNNRMSAT